MIKYKFTHSGHMSDAAIAGLYDIMDSEGLADFVFYDGNINNRHEFLNFIKGYRCWLVRCEHPERGIVGLWWLNEFVGKSAMLHFCTFGGSLEEKKDVCVQAMRWLADKKVLKSLYGLTPCVYRNVLPFMDTLGFERRGKLPGACKLFRHNRYVDGIISVLDLSKYDKGRTI